MKHNKFFYKASVTPRPLATLAVPNMCLLSAVLKLQD